MIADNSHPVPLKTVVFEEIKELYDSPTEENQKYWDAMAPRESKQKQRGKHMLRPISHSWERICTDRKPGRLRPLAWYSYPNRD